MEKIYTIPVNEAFEAAMAAEEITCPFCRLYDDLEEKELDLILGASMMEPDVRIKTNAAGFCRRHLDSMFTRKNRLGMALMMESHLAETRRMLEKGDFARLNRLCAPSGGSCYVCSRIDYALGKMLENAVWLWDADPEFQKKLDAQKCLCLPHTARWLQIGRDMLNRKKYAAFSEAVISVALRYYDTLSEDVSWFVKKFDYRYDEEPWGNAKDAVERCIRLLRARG